MFLYLKYFPDHKCRTYSKDKLTEVKEDWATYMVDDVFGEFLLSFSLKIIVGNILRREKSRIVEKGIATGAILNYK